MNCKFGSIWKFCVYSGDLAKAVKAKPALRFGLYHSMMDFYHPLYLQDKANGWRTDKFPVVCINIKPLIY